MASHSQPVPPLTKPRRKTSSSSNPSLIGRQKLEDVPVEYQDSIVFDDENDAMDVDDSSIPYHALNHPLRERAERIGKEVEVFAEEFDKYNTKQKKSQKLQRKELASMIKKFKDCADRNVKSLRLKYGPGLRQRFQNEWTARGRSQQDQDMDMDYQAGVDDLDRWQRESHTWSLFQSMLECDYPDMSFGNDPQRSKLSDRFAADGQSWRSFVLENDTAAERLKVLRWLESSAETTEDDLSLIESSLMGASGQDSSRLYDGWMSTQEQIKAQKRLRWWDASNDSPLPTIYTSHSQNLLVTQLDSDSVMRQNRSLEADDEQFEQAFWESCWEMLKRGYSMDSIYKWCADRHQSARAVGIGACPSNATNAIELPPHLRFLWRKACSAASHHSLTDYERLVYGLLSGQAETSAPTLQGWSDHLYVLYNNKLLQHYILHLNSYDQLDISNRSWSSFTLAADVTLKQDRIQSAQSLVESLESDPNSQVNPNIPFEPVQAALIAHEFVDLIKLQGIALARSKQQLIADLIQSEPLELLSEDAHIDFISDEPDMLRVLTHMYLVYLELGIDFGEGLDLQAAENVLCGYLRFLHFAGKRDLIPGYASKLSKPTCVDVLARVLPSIQNEQEQQDFVELMSKAGVDVPQIFTHQVTLTMSFSPSVKAALENPPNTITLTESVAQHYWPGYRIKPYKDQRLKEGDVVVIRALQWFLFIDGYWAKTFDSLTLAAIAFLRSGSIHLAGQLFDVLPFAAISKAKTPDYMNPVIDVTDESEEDNEASESGSEERFESYQLSPRKESRINRSFGESTRTYKPEKAKIQRDLYKAHATTYFELGQLVTALQAIYAWREMEEQALKTKSNKQLWPDCHKECRKAIDHLVSSMEPLLHNFLVNPSPCVKPPEILSEIRRMYLPEMMLAYTSALQAAGYILSRNHILQSLDLATDIANNDLLIEDIKSQGLMSALVDAFAHASKSLLHLKEISASKKRETPASTIWEDSE